jgi:hypothetical protein
MNERLRQSKNPNKYLIFIKIKCKNKDYHTVGTIPKSQKEAIAIPPNTNT